VTVMILSLEYPKTKDSKQFVKYNTNVLHNAFYLLIHALTCFGQNCWPSSGSS
jgi:uncharacterized membrane protein